MYKKLVGIFVLMLLIATSNIATANGEEDIVLIFSDDFNDNYLDLDNWSVIAVPPEYVRVEETNQRLEIDLDDISGQDIVGGIELLQNFTGEGFFEVDLQNGFSYTYLYKFLMLWAEENNYCVRLEFYDYGPIVLMIRTPEHPSWETTILFDGETNSWNWIFHLKLIRNSNGTFTGIVTDEYGHYFEGTTSLTIPLDVPLIPSLRSQKWKYGYPGMIFYDNFKAYGINNPPNIPTITGPNSGKPGVEYTYCINASDPDNDTLYVIWNWGDGTSGEWLGPYESGTEVCDSHTWEETGTYNISATIRDEYGASVTAYKEVTMPRDKAIIRPLLQFLQSHPNMFPILRQFLGL